MYTCINCGNTFDTPDVGCNKEEYWGAPIYEHFYICPVCGSDWIEELGKCLLSGQYLPTNEIYSEDVVTWGKDLIDCAICEIQNQYDCDYSTAKEFFRYVCEIKEI